MKDISLIKAKTREILAELQNVLAGRFKLFDSIFPPLIFLAVNAWVGFDWAIGVALAIAIGLAFLRIFRRESLFYALGGVVAVLFAYLLSRLIGGAEGYFLPSIVNSAVLVLLCIVSVLVGKPLAAWSSYLTRRWPLQWYWQPLIRPAYTEVTLIWGLFFLFKVITQLGLFQNQQADTLAWVSWISGWPALVLLLIASYLYGSWRLERLGGPSVDEYLAGALPPWQGQRRGF
jgi:hypothetical protein